jgi:hypothetical protein
MGPSIGVSVIGKTQQPGEHNAPNSSTDEHGRAIVYRATFRIV